MVYGTYLLGSINKSERSHRNLFQPLDFYGIELPLKMPVQVNRLSAYNFNNHELQKLSRIHLKYIVQDEQTEVVLSEYKTK